MVWDGNENNRSVGACVLVTRTNGNRFVRGIFVLAVANDNYNDASLLESQADKVYELAENVSIIIKEQGG